MALHHHTPAQRKKIRKGKKPAETELGRRLKNVRKK